MPAPPIVRCASWLASSPPAATLLQRFFSALNLNVRFPMLCLGGAYLADGAEPSVFRHLAAPGRNDLQPLVEQVAAGVCQALERRGPIERDRANARLSGAELGPLARRASDGACRDSGQAKGRADRADEQRARHSAGGPAGRRARRVSRQSAVGDQFRLTIEPLKRRGCLVWSDGLDFLAAWETHYGCDVFVTRKGAVRAAQRDLGVIPRSMGACS